MISILLPFSVIVQACLYWTWAQLLYINNVIITGIFVEKCALQAKDSHILSTKNNSVFAYVVGIYLKS